MPNNTDPAHRATERLIRQMEAELAKEYARAYRDISRKLDDYLQRFETKDRIWQTWVAEDKKTEAEYKEWRMGQLAVGKRWSEMKQTLAEDLHHANEIARSTVNGHMPEVYALNHDYATFEVERGSGIDTSYSLYDRQSLERIWRDDPELMPGYTPTSQVAKNIAAGKDIAWNRQMIQSAMVQGILQGESIDKMANRLMKVTTADYNAAVRYARTMSTNAQNAGRYDGYRRAEDLGIPLSLVWTATLDERTRFSHRQLDGQRRDVDQPFEVDGVKILYPADLGGKDYKVPGSMIWNCRCTIIAQVKGFEYDVHTDRTDYSQIDGDYATWKANHRSRSNPIDLPRRKAEVISGSYIRQYRGFSLQNNSQSATGSGTINFAKGRDIFVGAVDDIVTGEVTPDGIAEKLEESEVGRHALEYLKSKNLKFIYSYDDGIEGERGSQQGDILTIYVKKIKSNRVGAQTVVHEVEHHEQGIYGCKLAEAICYAKEKMLKENRTFIYDDEWADLQTLAAKQYPGYPYQNESIKKELSDYVKIITRKAEGQ